MSSTPRAGVTSAHRSRTSSPVAGPGGLYHSKGRADSMEDAHDRIEADAARVGGRVIRVCGWAETTGVEFSALIRVPT